MKRIPIIILLLSISCFGAVRTRYVRADADGSGDGSNTGVSQAWTLTQAIGSMGTVAGDVVKIQAGTYTRTASDVVAAETAGSATQPVLFVGCESDWDVVNPARASGYGALDTTNMPLINYSGNYNLTDGQSYHVWYGLRIESARTASYTFVVTGSVVKCAIKNTGNGTGAGAVYTSAIIDSDAYCDYGSGAAAITAYLTPGLVYGCRVSKSGGPGIQNTGVANAVFINNIVFGCASYNIYFNTTTAGRAITVVGNTVAGGKGIKTVDGAYTSTSIICNNHVVDGTEYGIAGPASQGSPVIAFNNNQHDNSSGDTIQGFGDWGAAMKSLPTNVVGAELSADPTDIFVNAASYDFRYKYSATLTGLFTWTQTGMTVGPLPAEQPKISIYVDGTIDGDSPAIMDAVYVPALAEVLSAADHYGAKSGASFVTGLEYTPSGSAGAGGGYTKPLGGALQE